MMSRTARRPAAATGFLLHSGATRAVPRRSLIWALVGGSRCGSVLVEIVLAGALTSLVLGHGLLGGFLLLIGIVVLSLVMRGHHLVPFGANQKTSNTSSTGL